MVKIKLKDGRTLPIEKNSVIALDNNGETLEVSAEEIESFETSDIDWEKRRYELAKEYSKEFVKLQHYKGLSENGLSNPKVIEWSVELADSLIEELKKNK